MTLDFRDEIRAQHKKLRSEIDRTRTAALSVLTGGAAGRLHEALASFRPALLSHLADEEKMLLPVLEKAGEAGFVRIDLLRAEHAQQRAVLALLAVSANTPPLLAKRTIMLCADLLEDMEFEETELLAVGVLPLRALP